MSRGSGFDGVLARVSGISIKANSCASDISAALDDNPSAVNYR